MSWWILPVIGLISGTIAGMGMGGGTLLIPCLVFFAGMDQKVAQGINLLFFLPTAAVATITYIRNKKINKDLVKGLVFYGLTGAIAGSVIAMSIRQEFLRILFGYFLLVVGAYEFFRKDYNNDKNKSGGDMNGT